MNEKQKRRLAAIQRQQALVDAAKNGKRQLTAEEEAEMQTLQREIEQLTTEIAAEEEQQVAETAAPSETDYYKDINNVYNLLSVEPIEMEFGYSLIPMVDESHGGKLISRIIIFRRQYAQDMGFVFPSIRLHDASSLGTNQYVIRIRARR